MPTPHISAEQGQVAPLVLMPGDPKRAARIAAEHLDGAELVSDVRGIGCWTGTWQGTPMSVMASGMGVPSVSIYATELFREYDVRSVIRVGSCGAMSERLAVRDLVIASGACTDSAMNRIAFEGLDYAPVADFGLLRSAYDAARAAGLDEGVHVGPVFSTDSFYSPRPELSARLAEYGVLAVEMEASTLYTVAARHGGRALAICTVSDHLLTGEETSSQEREQTFGAMAEIALAAGVAQQD